FNTAINKKEFLKPLPSAQRQTLLDDVIRLRQLDFYARYGDYAQRLVSNLRVRAKEKNINK
ncbi:hypothetical protein MMC14_006532, partial [Varicellaria rhodocarpa]|nr:hypothetical protein [Varicellaria rhodocarpa]